MTGRRYMEGGGERFFWWLQCANKCSFEKQSTDSAGDQRWLSERCPYDQTPLHEIEKVA